MPDFFSHEPNERIAALEAQVSDLQFELKELKLLNVTPMDCPKEWGITNMEKQVLEIVYTREGIVPYALVYNHLYGGVEDPPLYTIIAVYMTRLRRILRNIGAEVIT